MKTLLLLPSLLVAIIAWAGAVVDFTLAKISEIPRPYLVPGRTFLAAFRTCQAYLSGQPLDLQTFRIRDYPRHKVF